MIEGVMYIDFVLGFKMCGYCDVYVVDGFDDILVLVNDFVGFGDFVVFLGVGNII